MLTFLATGLQSRSTNCAELPFNGCRRVHLNQEFMRKNGISSGELLFLSASADPNQPYAFSTAWPSAELQTSCIEVSSCILRTINATNEDMLSVAKIISARGPHPACGDFPLARAIIVEELDITSHSFGFRHATTNERSDSVSDLLLLSLKEKLVGVRHISDQQIVEINYQGVKRSFRVVSVRTSLTTAAIEDSFGDLALWEGKQFFAHGAWRVGWDSDVSIRQTNDGLESISKYTIDQELGGLERQIQEVRELIDLPLSHPKLYRQFGIKPPRGILLHGPPGTGKTHFAKTIAKSSECNFMSVSGPELSSAFHGETEAKLRSVFREAELRAPCIILFDEIDAICPKREESGAGVEARVVTTLLTLLDGLTSTQSEANGKSSYVIVVATTNRPNAIDPALRRPGRLDREIEVGIPDAKARHSILSVLLKQIPHTIPQTELQQIAFQRTHGFVGADLGAAIRDASNRAIRRFLEEKVTSAPSVTSADLLLAISSTRPSALREYFVETPTVRWGDIGGQSLVKQKLRESVEWPLLHWETFNRLGVRPPKGVLLYGPPGCSKTLTAKALATESGINFIAVKGPELLNKYVGESERAVRQIFQKARQAAPSIIFFDEVDALAASRSGEDHHKGVLTSLLNELDGIQELVGVVVVAATNQPEVMDTAIIRPGRLDRLLYVGPPDSSARLEILEVITKRMAVDPSLNLEQLAELTHGCSGAEIAYMCQEAALLTMKRDIGSLFVHQSDFIQAARNIQRQITPELITKFERWGQTCGAGY
ncbi:P-loop containing nucleoside triphosphate hydrolase protein [Cantharellus anzutake]|uniref:P-loop containing nucleoside triphosphate hydrolase protein n=1 Tax=Cantharellus anzutake TaxID=1750568 RepID=UPI001906F71A|nr:P-loop containing nucleoside triphosphate hydrolase protein [Cantharellus anzutake]KAF8333554.1 P-loop containing nucleoside triphosphate hydrolase protein [Cantharellus anzutake]